MSDDDKRWTAYPAEEQIWRNDRVYYVSCDGPATLLRDIAARLNGPSPAEVAALLRSVESSGRDICSNAICPSCGADFDIQVGGRAPGEHFADCKLNAMIKQCEGA